MEDIFKINSREKLISSLSDLLNESNSECSPFVDLTDQTLGMHTDSAYTDIDENEKLEGHEIVDIDSVSSHEGFSFMKRFAISRRDIEQDKLLRVLSQRHPFRAFRSELERLGILQEWYSFKQNAYDELAKERLEDVSVDYVDGRIVCSDPDLIKTVTADNDDDELDHDYDDLDEE